MPFITMERVSAPPRTCKTCQRGTFGNQWAIWEVYVDDHVPDHFVVSNEVGVLFLGFEKAVQEVVLALSHLRVLHPFHETLDGEAGRDREVVEFVDEAGPAGVLAEPFVEGGDLSDLSGLVLGSGRRGKD
jgi:hypothetical protein